MFTGADPDGGVQRQPRWHIIFQTVAIIAITVDVGVSLYVQHANIGEGLRQIGSIEWRWVVVAGMCELVSMTALALLYRDLLRVNETRLGVSWILACCLASNAISLSVPVIGSGIATRRTFRRFRQGGSGCDHRELRLDGGRRRLRRDYGDSGCRRSGSLG